MHQLQANAPGFFIVADFWLLPLFLPAVPLYFLILEE
jgi:hypothetical protein